MTKTYIESALQGKNQGKKRNKKTHSHLANSALDVLTERISGAPASVTLKSISVVPFHNPQVGVISDGSHFKLGLSVNTKLRNDSENDFPNVVISFKSVFSAPKKKDGK
jgi:hypothetical protein